MRAALVQLSSGDIPADNVPVTEAFIREAANADAQFILTPEVSNCVSADRSWQREVLQTEADDETLARLRRVSDELGCWLLIGSLALKHETEDRFVNRSFLIDPSGRIAARYDKIHMFDVEVSEVETYRESAGFKPGSTLSVGAVADLAIGLSICYDVRFPNLFRALSKRGANVLTVPSAFSRVTGAAHWEPLLRARAIENGAYVLAPAQTGTHPTSTHRKRKTYGHSMAVSPWGEVLVDAGLSPGVSYVELDVQAVKDARRRIPSLTHDREFEGP